LSKSCREAMLNMLKLIAELPPRTLPLAHP
jgi:hypothetical protein